MEPSLDTNIQFLTGVGPKRAALYQKLDIFTIRDLLYYFPRSYIDLSSPCEIAALPAWETCGVKARVVAKSAPQYVRRGMTISRVRVADDTGSMVITFFNAKYTVDALHYDQEYLFYGRTGAPGRAEMTAPSIYPVQQAGGLIPVYPLTQGLSSKMISANIAQALQMAERKIPDPLPAPSTVSAVPPALCFAEHPFSHRPGERPACPQSFGIRGAADALPLAAFGAQ